MCHDAQLVLDSLWDAKPVQFDVTNHRQAAVEFLGATDNTGSSIEDPMQPVCRGLWLAPPPSLRISSTTFTECAPKAMEFAEIMQNNGHYAVQGHSRSSILVPIESSYVIRFQAGGCRRRPNLDLIVSC